MKNEQIYACAKCGAQFQKWSGRCTGCGAWGTIGEDALETEEAAPARALSKKPGNTNAFSDLTKENGSVERVKTLHAPFDALLGGGLVPGSVTLFGGEPGIGKSTLLSQIALTLSQTGQSVLYVTGEESPSQVRLRLERLAPAIPPSLRFLDRNDAEVIAATILKEKPALVIADSVQTLRVESVSGEPGNISQIKAGASILTEAAKKSGVPLVLVGQVTKDGDLAGPRLLEHLVDTVLMLEGDRSHAFRILRVLKHRFGNTEECSVFSMTERGLEIVSDPSSALLADRPVQASGTIVSCLLEGGHPLACELQALIAPAGYGTPLRRVSGFDSNRVSLLLAVLGRRAGVPCADMDVFFNVVGGIRVSEPGLDLAVAVALASAKYDCAVPDSIMAWGEVGLAGELRPVSRPEARLKEAKRLGFKTVIVPKQKKQVSLDGIEIRACSTLREAIQTAGLKKS